MALAESVIGVAGKVLDKFVEDKDLKAKLEHEMKMQLHNANLAQVEVNKAEATHKSLFVAGWRPACGWICSIALLYHFVLQPIIVFILSAAGYSYDLPSFDMSSLMTVLMGCLLYTSELPTKA